MTESSVRALIVAAIEEADEPGMVYDHIPWSSTWDVHLDQFKCEINGRNMLRGFTVSMVEMEQTGIIFEADTDTDTRSYTYEILGYQGIKQADETENEFLEVVLDVMEKLDAKSITSYPRPRSQLVSYRPDMVGSVLSHVAQITVSGVRERVDCE